MNGWKINEKHCSAWWFAWISTNNKVLITVSKRIENLQRWVNWLPACGKFCLLLITFANSLDPNQARHNVRPDLDPSCMTLRYHSWKKILKKIMLRNFCRRQNIVTKLPSMQRRVNWPYIHCETRRIGEWLDVEGGGHNEKARKMIPVNPDK